MQEPFLVRLALLVRTLIYSLRFTSDRLYLQRYMYSVAPGDTYWPRVDEQLKQMEKEPVEVRKGQAH